MKAELGGLQLSEVEPLRGSSASALPTFGGSPLLWSIIGVALALTVGQAAAAPPSACTPNENGIVRDLMQNYGGDKARIRHVAKHAEYAVLAWAAYDPHTETVQPLLKSYGWRVKHTFDDQTAYFGGHVEAILFENSDGRLVLAFQGSAPDRDWVTNAGTLDVTGLLHSQVRVATEIAREVSAAHPNVTFVGHSLGGRLAQVARYDTGKSAVVFNSAPMSLHDWGNAAFDVANSAGRAASARQRSVLRPLIAFRAPDDTVSTLDPFAVQVTSLERPEFKSAVPTLSLRLAADYFHNIGVLAEEMHAIRASVAKGALERCPSAKVNSKLRWGPGKELRWGTGKELRWGRPYKSTFD